MILHIYDGTAPWRIRRDAGAGRGIYAFFDRRFCGFIHSKGRDVENFVDKSADFNGFSAVFHSFHRPLAKIFPRAGD